VGTWSACQPIPAACRCRHRPSGEALGTPRRLQSRNSSWPRREIARIGSWADVAPVLPPPARLWSPEALRGVSTGMTRGGNVLKLGPPFLPKSPCLRMAMWSKQYSYHPERPKVSAVSS